MCVQRYSRWSTCHHSINYHIEQCTDAYRSGTICDPLDEGGSMLNLKSGDSVCPDCSGNEAERAEAEAVAKEAEQKHKQALEARAAARTKLLQQARANSEDDYQAQMQDLRREGLQQSVARPLPRGGGAAGGSSSRSMARPGPSSAGSSSASQLTQEPRMSGARGGGASMSAAAAMDELPEGQDNRTRPRGLPRGGSSASGPVVRDFGADSQSQHRSPGSNAHLTIPEESEEEAYDGGRDAYGVHPGVQHDAPGTLSSMRAARSPRPVSPEPQYQEPGSMSNEHDDRPYIEPSAADLERALAASRDSYAKQPMPEGAMADDDPEFMALLEHTRDQYEMGEGAERERKEMEEIMEMSKRFAETEMLDRWSRSAKGAKSGGGGGAGGTSSSAGLAGSRPGGGVEGEGGPSSAELSKAEKKNQALEAENRCASGPGAGTEHGQADQTHVRNRRLAALSGGGPTSSSVPPNWGEEEEDGEAGSSSKGKGKARAE